MIINLIIKAVSWKVIVYLYENISKIKKISHTPLIVKYLFPFFMRHHSFASRMNFFKHVITTFNYTAAKKMLKDNIPLFLGKDDVSKSKTTFIFFYEGKLRLKLFYCMSFFPSVIDWPDISSPNSDLTIEMYSSYFTVFVSCS